MALWTPWIDRNIKKKIQRIDFLDDFFIFDPWPAIVDLLDLYIDAGNHLELKILTSASHCLNMVSIRALGCPFMAKQGAENLEKPMKNQGFWSTGLVPKCAIAQGSAVDAGLV